LISAENFTDKCSPKSNIGTYIYTYMNLYMYYGQ
jgi:hypothetical protein